MNWFQHDTSATQDAKIKKLIIRHGAEGYAVYFHCLELIAADTSETNLTFELEHDSEIIADNLKIKGDSEKSGREKTELIMKTIIELGLFQECDGRVFCLKLIKRINLSQTSKPSFRVAISQKRDEIQSIMTDHDKAMTDHAVVMSARHEYQPTNNTNHTTPHQEACAPEPVSKNPTDSKFHQTVHEHWSSLAGVPKPPEYMHWIMGQDYRDFLEATKGYHSSDVLGAIDNFAKIIADPGSYWIKSRPSLKAFFRGEVFQACRPGVFPAAALKDPGRGEGPEVDPERAKYEAEMERLIAEEKAQDAQRVGA